MTKEALKLARQLLWRYRYETPIGHQPYMICHEADEAFERIDKALAQPTQEPWVSLTSEQVQECADNSYYHSAWSSEVDLALFAQNLDAALRKANT